MISSKNDLTENGDFGVRADRLSDTLGGKYWTIVNNRFVDLRVVLPKEFSRRSLRFNPDIFKTRLHVDNRYGAFNRSKYEEKVSEFRVCRYCGKSLSAPWNQSFAVGVCTSCASSGLGYTCNDSLNFSITPRDAFVSKSVKKYPWQISPNHTEMPDSRDFLNLR